MENRFKDRLKRARKGVGFSQADLAREIGISQRAISLYETGIKKPSFETLIMLCHALKCSADYLTGLEP